VTHCPKGGLDGRVRGPDDDPGDARGQGRLFGRSVTRTRRTAHDYFPRRAAMARASPLSRIPGYELVSLARAGFHKPPPQRRCVRS
jgi:hypothetical protein